MPLSLFKKDPPKEQSTDAPNPEFTQQKSMLEDRIEGLKRKSAVMEQILQDIQEGIITTNSLGLVNWANKKALETLKSTWSLAENKKISELLPEIDKVQSGSSRVTLQTLDDEKVVVDVKSYNLGSHGKSSGKLYTLEDVTDKVALEEMKVDFVAIAAHQLRTPLTAIKGYLTVLSEAAASKLDTQEQVFLNRALVSSDRLDTIIENILSVSRIEEGAFEISLRPVDIEKVVKDAIVGLAENAKQTNVTLIPDIRFSPYPTILGDPDLLSEAISNVIVNAIKYNKPGGQVSVSLEKHPGEVTVHVSDTGKGIPEEVMPNLFQRFYVGSSSLSELSQGLGLGLYISKSIVEAHRGKINLSSLEGKGTTVSITLPVEETTPTLG